MVRNRNMIVSSSLTLQKMEKWNKGEASPIVSKIQDAMEVTNPPREDEIYIPAEGCDDVTIPMLQRDKPCCSQSNSAPTSPPTIYKNNFKLSDHKTGYTVKENKDASSNYNYWGKKSAKK